MGINYSSLLITVGLCWLEGGSFLALLYWGSDYLRPVFSLCCLACVCHVAVFAAPWLSLALSSHLKRVSSPWVPLVMSLWGFKFTVAVCFVPRSPRKGQNHKGMKSVLPQMTYLCFLIWMNVALLLSHFQKRKEKKKNPTIPLLPPKATTLKNSPKPK